MKTELKFDKVKEEKVKFLEQNKNIVLATSLNNIVTARTVAYASEGLTIIFFTLTNLKKLSQIKANAKVALCINNVSIEGLAQIVGSPQEKESKRLMEIYKKKFPVVSKWWFTRTPEQLVFVKVTPTLIVSWVEKESAPFMEYLDLQNETAYLTTRWENQE